MPARTPAGGPGSGGPEDIRRTRRLRNQRDYRADGTEYVGRRGRIRDSAEFVARQIDAIVKDIGADAVKTGMLSSSAIIETVAAKIREHALRPLVVDPVMVAKSGDAL